MNTNSALTFLAAATTLPLAGHANDARRGAAQRSAAESVIPFRGWVRKLDGATTWKYLDES